MALNYNRPSFDPTRLVIHSWAFIEEEWGVDVEDRLDDGQDRHVIVLRSVDYAVKIVRNDNPTIAAELRVGDFINQVSRDTQTNLFSHTEGYVLSNELPPGFTLGENDNWDGSFYLYIFTSLIEFPFSDFPDDADANEAFYLSMLVALYYARRAGNFVHHDIHEKNLMFNEHDAPALHTYRIDDDTFFSITSKYDPKLIDFGKSVMDPNYRGTGEMQYKRFWDKSDISHLTSIFLDREATLEFRAFLERVHSAFFESRYAKKLSLDSGARADLVKELLLRCESHVSKTIDCRVCGNVAQAVVGETHFFCGVKCHDAFYCINPIADALNQVNAS